MSKIHINQSINCQSTEENKLKVNILTIQKLLLAIPAVKKMFLQILKTAKAA